MKKDFIPNLVIIVATTLLVVVVFYNIYVFVPSIQNTFGNLADWFMVVITAITAVFIYRTLNSQMEVQRDQEKINKLNMYDMRSKYLPRIVINQRETSFLGYDEKTLWEMHFKVEDHHAQYITLKCNFPFYSSHECEYYKENEFYYAKYDMLSKETSFYIAINHTVVENYIKLTKSDASMLHSYNPYTKIEFEYKDNFGFDYYNTFLYEYQPATRVVRIRDSNIDFL